MHLMLLNKYDGTRHDMTPLRNAVLFPYLFRDYISKRVLPSIMHAGLQLKPCDTYHIPCMPSF